MAYGPKSKTKRAPAQHAAMLTPCENRETKLLSSMQYMSIVSNDISRLIKATLLCGRPIGHTTVRLLQSVSPSVCLSLPYGVWSPNSKAKWCGETTIDTGVFACVLLIYTVVHKKRATLFLTITPMFHGGFLHLLYQWKQE